MALEPGLSDVEVKAAEAAYRVHFPPDLRDVLQTALPVDSRGHKADSHMVPNWRDLSDFRTFGRLNWPWLGAVFDIERGADRGWLAAWGPPPPDLPSWIRRFGDRFDAAPRLIPIYSHRYIPQEPSLAGNPVFSVHQLDVICYGSDLANYLVREFFRSPDSERPDFGEIRDIPFWSEFANLD